MIIIILLIAFGIYCMIKHDLEEYEDIEKWEDMRK